MNDDIRDEGLSRLYRASAGAEPPATLDAAVVAAARAALAPPRRPAWRRWTLPMSVAATVVTTVTLTMLVHQALEPQPSHAPAAAESPAAAAPASEPAVRQSEITAADVRPAPSPAARPAPQEHRADTVKTLPPAAPAPAASAESESAARPAAELRAPARPLADADEMRAKSSVLRQEALGAAAKRPPETWLDEIRQMRRQGRDTEAAESLAAFRKAYPDYALPEDLR